MNAKGKKILAVGAHPDDVEFMCSGTLLLLRELGCELHVATLTLGDLGTMDRSRREIAEIRRGEAEAACRRLGAHYHYGGFHDFGIYIDDDSNRRVTALFREVRPWMVLTHPPVDYMSDHEFASRLVRNACFYAGVPNYATVNYSCAEPTDGIPYLYYAQPAEGIDIYGGEVVPDFYVEVTDEIGEKERLLACHDSQRSWLRDYHGMDEYLESLRRWGEGMGKRASQIAGREITFAEGFRQHRGHAYPADNVLAELLPERIIPV